LEPKVAVVSVLVGCTKRKAQRRSDLRTPRQKYPSEANGGELRHPRSAQYVPHGLFGVLFPEMAGQAEADKMHGLHG